mgnify:CR=1 FL=1
MIKPEKETEDSTYAYLRPKDAATLILIDRSAETPKVLVGKRHDKVVFQPGKFVFPGGRVDATGAGRRGPGRRQGPARGAPQSPAPFATAPRTLSNPPRRRGRKKTKPLTVPDG